MSSIILIWYSIGFVTVVTVEYIEYIRTKDTNYKLTLYQLFEDFLFSLLGPIMLYLFIVVYFKEFKDITGKIVLFDKKIYTKKKEIKKVKKEESKKQPFIL